MQDLNCEQTAGYYLSLTCFYTSCEREQHCMLGVQHAGLYVGLSVVLERISVIICNLSVAKYTLLSVKPRSDSSYLLVVIAM